MVDANRIVSLIHDLEYDCLIVVIDVYRVKWREQRCHSFFSFLHVVRPWNLTFIFLSLSGDVN